MLEEYAQHAFISMLPAIRRLLATLDVKVRLPRAGVMLTKSVGCVYHAVFSMLLAVYHRLAALDITRRVFRAGDM